MMPKLGSLWIWRGNAYDVIGTFGQCVSLREHGSGEILTQCLTPLPDGLIACPSR